MLLESGALLAMAHIQGVPFELADHAARNARLRLLNTLYRNLADDNVTIYTHLVRHVELTPEGQAPQSRHQTRQFRSRFGAGLDAAYRQAVLADRLYRNDYYISL